MESSNKVDLKFHSRSMDLFESLGPAVIPSIFENKLIVQRICEIYRYNCAKNDKGLKIGTKEADII